MMGALLYLEYILVLKFHLGKQKHFISMFCGEMMCSSIAFFVGGDNGYVSNSCAHTRARTHTHTHSMCRWMHPHTWHVRVCVCSHSEREHMTSYYHTVGILCHCIIVSSSDP